MKRTLALFLSALMVLFAVPVTARAASENVTLSVKADKSTASPGDTVNFTVSIGAVNSLGALEFSLKLPAGLTIAEDSVSVPAGLKETMDSADDIVVPSGANKYKWSYGAADTGYAGADELVLVTFSCTVSSDAAPGEVTVTLELQDCYDNSLPRPKEHTASVVPTSVTIEKEGGAVSCEHSLTKVEAVDATCEEDGNVEYYVCGKCGVKFADAAGATVIEEVAVKATGHKPAGAWESDADSHWQICSVCGKEIKSSHSYEWVVDAEATESSTGLKHEECLCGAKRSLNTIIDKVESAEEEAEDEDTGVDWKELEKKEAETDTNGNINMSVGNDIIVPVSVLNELVKSNKVLALHTRTGATFSIQPSDLKKVAIKEDLDLSLVASQAAADVVAQKTSGTITSRQFATANKGNFAVKVDVHFCFGAANADKYANIYSYNAKSKTYDYRGSLKLNATGSMMYALTQGGDFLVTVTDGKAAGGAVIASADGYVVQPGDTLTKIAAKYGMSVKTLITKNPQITDPNYIVDGQIINL